MKKIVTLILVLFNLAIGFADEPPSWLPYKKISENLGYFAWVNYADKDSLKNPWERKWSLSVYDKDSILLWEKDLKPSGYEHGTLTDDGENFVIVEFWYHDQEDVVSIFHKNSKDFFIKGSEFKIPALFLSETISHKRWVENYEIIGNELFITTLDQSSWKIDITKKELSKEVHSKYQLIILMIIALILILFVFLIIKRRKNPKSQTKFNRKY